MERYLKAKHQGVFEPCSIYLREEKTQEGVGGVVQSALDLSER